MRLCYTKRRSRGPSRKSLGRKERLKKIRYTCLYLRMGYMQSVESSHPRNKRYRSEDPGRYPVKETRPKRTARLV